jgi:putative endonuclease
MKEYYVYILECSDQTYYTGITSDLNKRIKQHCSGYDKQAYTYRRRPLKLMYFTTFSEVGIAIEFEKRIKKWSRKKKEALIASEYDKLPNLSKKKF